MRLVPLILLVVVADVASGQIGGEQPPIHLPPVVPSSLRLLIQPAVQTELRLTPRQKLAVEELNGAWSISPRAWEFGTIGLVTPEMGRAAVMQRSKEFLDTGLTKDQRARLDQIEFQLREREFGAYAAFAMAARDLGLREDQLEDMTNLKGLRVDEIAKAVTSGKRYAKIKDRVAVTNGDTFEKMTEMLTKTQRERLKEMRGKPFGAKVDFAPTPSPALDIPKDIGSIYRGELFGIYEFELKYLNWEYLWGWGIRGFLSRQQAVERDASQAEWARTYMYVGRAPFREFSRLHELTEKALDKILTKDQRDRFDLIMMQRRLAAGGVTAMCGYPGAVGRLKLTPIQLARLKDSKPFEEVLTKDQLELVKAIPTPKLDENDFYYVQHHIEIMRGPRLVETRRYATASAFLAIADRVKLSQEQIQNLRELADDEPKIMELIQRELDFADTPPVIGSTRSLTSANVVASRFKESIEEQCWNVLDAQQQSTARRIFGVKR